MSIPLINPYPMMQAPHSPLLIQQQEAAIKFGIECDPLPKLVSISTPEEHIISALNNFSTNIITSMIKEKLNGLYSYKDALNSMPNLSQVKGLSNYRKRHPNHDLAAVEIEIEQHALPLASGQVIFHGGIFPKDHYGRPVMNFVTDRPLSTSLCAQVAAVHSLNHQPKEVWLIRIAQSASVKAFVFSNADTQTHGHETEILIAQGACVSLHSFFQEKDFTIYSVELR